MTGSDRFIFAVAVAVLAGGIVLIWRKRKAPVKQAEE